VELGFDTVGNATLVAYDNDPVLATDPWLEGSAYYGSWRLSTEIPAEQLAAIHAAPFVWVSHGHPDHLHMPSLAQLRDKTVLLPDHAGGRIRDFLVDDGYRVEVMPDRKWRALSPRVRICSIADFNQDATLLVDIDGTLIVNANDASDRGWADFVRRETRRADPTFLLGLSGYGDADMINYFTEAGERIPPPAAAKVPPGPAIAARMQRVGARYFVPFASHHCYQRTDSMWANEFTTPVEDHARGFDAPGREILPAFVRYDCRGGDVTPLDPPAPAIVAHDPAEFGDDWDEPLTPEDVKVAHEYFGAITTLRGAVDEIVLDVAGESHVIRIGNGAGRSVTFAAPRASLTNAMTWEVFDDLLIGNFMRTTLHGNWPHRSLNPEFTAPVCKYADNGRAKTPEQVRAYFHEYRNRAPLSYLRFRFAERRAAVIRASAARARSVVSEGSLAHRAGKSAYARIRKIT
jgi:L-ascorbate metabolism protein UlaG (beta-lactamase superfamily)